MHLEKMFFQCWLLFALCFTPGISVPMTVFEKGQFYPNSATAYLTSVDFVTKDECMCRCYENRLCLTGNYIEKEQSCAMFSVQLGGGEVRIAVHGVASVFNFPDKIITHDPIIPPAIMEWSFDRNFIDTYNTWDGTFSSSKASIDQQSDELWASPGYAGYGSAVHFPPNSYYIINQDFNLATTDFTVSVWFAVTFNFTADAFDNFSFFSHCQMRDTRQCLHLLAGRDRFQFAFFDDDLVIGFPMNLYQWYHVAFVYERSSLMQRIFTNGNLRATRGPAGLYMGNATTIALGGIPLMPGSNINSGYIDKLTFVSRVKTDKEILDEATLVAYYPFDGSYLDAGPNKITNMTQVATTFDDLGQVRQALLFDLTNPSYFQTNGFYFLGQTNYSYSFTLWIRPMENLGTILQVNASNGWSVPMIGFNRSGYLTVQTLGNAGLYAVSSNITTPLSQWIHVSLTYSSRRGIRLFVNGSLVSRNSTFSDYSASGQMCTITVGTYLPPDQGMGIISAISLAQYRGKVDELKIFSRELTASEISQLP